MTKFFYIIFRHAKVPSSDEGQRFAGDRAVQRPVYGPYNGDFGLSDTQNDKLETSSTCPSRKTLILWFAGLCGNWIEIAYGTRSGSVRVIVQHPETVGHSPQLFQTFTVHQSPVTKVKLSEDFLISVCSEYNHVRTWRVPRFRGMISTQPGSTPEASFKVI